MQKLKPLVAKVLLILSIPAGQAAWAGPVGGAFGSLSKETYCSNGEQVLFDCAAQQVQHISICASKKLTEESGYVQFRMGKEGGMPVLIFPEDFRLPNPPPSAPDAAKNALLGLGFNSASPFEALSSEFAPQIWIDFFYKGESYRLEWHPVKSHPDTGIAFLELPYQKTSKKLYCHRKSIYQNLGPTMELFGWNFN